MWELNYLPKLFEIISLFQTINYHLFHPMKHFVAMTSNHDLVIQTNTLLSVLFHPMKL
jgi:hypothetical protein